MHLPEIDKYAGLNSVFHSWDPRLKIISFSFLIVSVALVSNFLLACLGLAIAIIFVFVSKIPLTFVLRQLKWVMFFILFFLVVMPLTVSGDKIVIFNFIAISLKGLKLALLIAVRAITICLLIFPMFGTAKFHKSLKALQKLKLPNKLIQITMFTYRYIFVFMEEFGKMFTAARARLFKERTNIFTLKIISNLTGMLFIRGFERTQGVYHAMASRGYNGDMKDLDEFKLCTKDFIISLFVVTLAVILNLARLIL